MTPLTLSSNPIPWVIALAALSLLPFILTLTTSFLKFSVVLSLLRQALGTQQTPPNHVLIALAAILSCFVMAPTANQSLDLLNQEITAWQSVQPPAPLRLNDLPPIVDRISSPMRQFLQRHTHPEEQQSLTNIATQMHSPNSSSPHQNDFLVLIPAFALSQLKEAFIIGFLLFIPFILIDLLTANILLSLGMHMLSPTTISLPIKILLFILANGWSLLIQGLTTSYL